MENGIEVPQKIKNRITVWSRNPASGYVSQEDKIIVLKRYLYSYAHCSIIHNSQGMEAT